MGNSNVTFDDTDASIVYTPAGNWQHVSGLTEEFDGTRSGAAFAGMTASFNFTGTRVFVYGSQGSIDVFGQPVTTYLIDDNSALSATYTAEYIEPGGYTTNTLFYASPQLSNSPHQLLITNLNGTAPSIFWLDSIVVTSDPDSLSSSATPTFSRSSSSSQSQIPTSILTPPLTSSSTPTGAIIGGVIGGVALVLGAILAFLFYRRRQRRYMEELPVSEESKDWSAVPTPFMAAVSGLSAREPPLSSNPVLAREYSPQASATTLPTTAAYTVPATTSTPPQTTPSPQTVTSASRSRKGNPIPPPIVLSHHEDSGARLHTDTTSAQAAPPASVVDVPPAYTTL